MNSEEFGVSFNGGFYQNNFIFQLKKFFVQNSLKILGNSFELMWGSVKNFHPFL